MAVVTLYDMWGGIVEFDHIDDWKEYFDKHEAPYIGKCLFDEYIEVKKKGSWDRSGEYHIWSGGEKINEAYWIVEN